MGKETCALAEPVMAKASSSTAISIKEIVRKALELLAVVISISSSSPYLGEGITAFSIRTT
jgi:hypothetical protein